MTDINCPYCDAENEINHDDGYGYQEGVLHEQQCRKCEKWFTYETSISFYYEPFKADCLNDGIHDYQPTRTFPRECTRMKCATCGTERPCTDEEMKAVLSPSNS